MLFCCADSTSAAAVVQADQADQDVIAEVPLEEPVKNAAEIAEMKTAQETEVADAGAVKLNEDVARKTSEDEAAPCRKVDGPKEFVVEITMDSQKTPIGMRLHPSTGVVQIVHDGLLAAKHNASGVGEKIQSGDKLVSVDGCQPAECMTSILEAYKIFPVGASMKLKFVRAALKPQEFVVEVRMDSQKTPIGLKINPATCIVQFIHDGSLTSKHNSSGVGEKIKLMDQLISVNGCEQAQCVATIQAAYKILPEGTTLTLKLLRPASK